MYAFAPAILTTWWRTGSLLELEFQRSVAPDEVNQVFQLAFLVQLHLHFNHGRADRLVRQHSLHHFDHLGRRYMQDVSANPQIVRKNTGCVSELIGPDRENHHWDPRVHTFPDGSRAAPGDGEISLFEYRELWNSCEQMDIGRKGPAPQRFVKWPARQNQLPLFTLRKS